MPADLADQALTVAQFEARHGSQKFTHTLVSPFVRSLPFQDAK